MIKEKDERALEQKVKKLQGYFSLLTQESREVTNKVLEFVKNVH